ncbi:MAG: NAD(P)-dependent oxidoreductase [Desulfobacteraceae bacterium]|nr:NAD(P)-dependent oxidoreductase [Desulfobacteraceae bacterium]
MATNLITGGMGFVGAYLARELLAEGEEVVLFQRRSKLPPSLADLEDKVKIFSGDVSNWVHVVDAVKSNDVDCIYHTAALLSKDCHASPATGFQVNVVGTFNILEAARILGVSHVIYTSTGYAESLSPPKKFFDDTPLRPSNMYETTKFCSEHLGAQYSRQYDINFRGMRLAMIIGPTRQISYYHGDYSGTVERSAQGKPHTIHVDPSMPQSIIYVKDVAHALIALKRVDSNKLRQHMYNVSGFMATMQEIADTVEKCLPEAQIDFDLDRSEEMRIASLADSYEMDNTAAQEDFGWQPRYPLDDTVLDFINEVKAGKAG